MSENISVILIVSESVRLRDSLRVFLQTCFPKAMIADAETCTAAFQRLLDVPRALVLLDADLLEISLQSGWDGLNSCLVLAHSVEQQLRARNAGLKVVLLDRFTAANLCAAVDAGIH